MRVIMFDGITSERPFVIEAIQNGSVFIYPTDTIYGIGCNAQDSDAVNKIRKMKSRISNPFSVIAPSLDWIKENCIVPKEGEEWLKKLPGPYTLILKLKNKDCIAKEANMGLNTLGVRMPKHWIKDIAEELGIPIISTSVNKSGEEYMTSLEDLDDSFKENVDFVIYEGKKEGRPSKIIDLSGKIRIIER